MRVAALVVLLLVTAGCGSSRRVVARITPKSSVEAQPLHISVRGLRPHEVVDLRLRSTDADGVAFTAHARFRATAEGIVDLAHAKPLAGSSYSPVWPMGLLTSMQAVARPPATLYEWRDKPQTFALTVSSGGKTIATARAGRRFVRIRPKRVQTTVAKDGFLGTFYALRGAVHRAAVLAFGGSEGGLPSRWEGDQLAADGIPTLEVAYFHAPTVPDKLVDIPLEYFRAALEWLERRPEVDASRTSVLSASYGTEAALLLGVHYPKLVHGVVALTPSGVVTCGIAGAHRDEGCLGSPWSLHDKPLPYTKLFNNPAPFDVPKAVIPVERIKAPVFLSCGGLDQVWSSCPYARAIVKRRRGETTILRDYPNAGHYSNGAFFEYEPGVLARDLFSPGTELAREDLRPRVLRFLQRS